MGDREKGIDARRQRLGLVVRELAADLVEERRRRLVLSREVRELRLRLAAYETTDQGAALKLSAASGGSTTPEGRSDAIA